MSWAEYTIRVDGYLRQQKRELRRDRRTWFTTLIAPHQDPKRLPRTEEAYMKIDGDKKRKLSDAARSKFVEALEKYKAQKEKANGRGDQPGN